MDAFGQAVLRDSHTVGGKVGLDHLSHHQHPSHLPPLMHYLPVFVDTAICGAVQRKFPSSRELEWVFKSKLLAAFCGSCAAAADSGYCYEDPWEGEG